MSVLEIIKSKGTDCSGSVKFLEGKSTFEALTQCDRGDWLFSFMFGMKDEEGFPDINQLRRAGAICLHLIDELIIDERSRWALWVIKDVAGGDPEFYLDEAARQAYAALYPCYNKGDDYYAAAYSVYALSVLDNREAAVAVMFCEALAVSYRFAYDRKLAREKRRENFSKTAEILKHELKLYEIYEKID